MSQLIILKKEQEGEGPLKQGGQAERGPTRRRLRAVLLIGALLVLAVVAFAIKHFSGAPVVSGNTQSAGVPVTAAMAIRKDVPNLVSTIGTVQSIDSVAIQPRVAGQIQNIEFTPGQDVKQGQELFLIDPRPYQAALNQALGQLAHDQAVLKEAQVDLARYQALAKTKAIAVQQEQDQAFVVQQDQGTVQARRSKCGNRQAQSGVLPHNLADQRPRRYAAGPTW